MKTKSVIKQAKEIIDDTARRLTAKVKEEVKKKERHPKLETQIVWDVPLSAEVTCFDANLSYELSGYRPINRDQGLDFDPEWFVDARNEYLESGHYTTFLPGSKGYREFWHEEYRRCREGYTVNGYTITGEHYFFLNYYQLPIVSNEQKAGSGRVKNFPSFFVSQYQFFHYIDLAKKLHKHIALMKARGIGFSELSASMAANQYTTIRESITMIACFDKGKLERTLSKAWTALQFLDAHTDRGMFKLRQLSDTALLKKSGHYNMSRGNKEPAGWQSVIEGVVADDPQKIRGDRVDLMILDEGGCHAPGTKVLMSDFSTKKVEDIKLGDKVMGPDGADRNVIQLHSGKDTMYKITLSNGDTQVVNSNHLIYGEILDSSVGVWKRCTVKAKEFYKVSKEDPMRASQFFILKAAWRLKTSKRNDFGNIAYTCTIEEVGEGEYYGFSLDGDQLFLLEDYTICHNSWPDLLKAFVQAQALVEVQGVAFGTIQVGGTGGDKGSALAGLNTIYYHPEPYGILPYRHNYTSDGSTILSSYFIPAFTQSMVPGMTDARGWCDDVKNKEYLQKKRDQYLNVPQSLIHHCAEYCWNAEEAFALEGENKFNKQLLSEQLAQIRLHKLGPRPVRGYIDYIYKDGKHDFDAVEGFKWTPNKEGTIQILEHPVWSDQYKIDIKRAKQKALDGGVSYEEPTVYQEMSDLYVAGVDGIDIGANQTSGETRDPSQFCLVIKRRAYGLRDPQIVCVYMDRPNEIRTAYKNAMCLIRYYNCKVNVEATRVGFINWARYNNLLKWFMKRPQATFQDIKRVNTKAYGTPATTTIIELQTDLIANFVEDYCHTIWFEDVLDQLVRYNIKNKTKFDIIAALGMVELADQELSGRQPLRVEQEDATFVNFGYYIGEDGYKRFGVIPNKKDKKVTFKDRSGYDPYRVETTDPRYYTVFN